MVSQCRSVGYRIRGKTADLTFVQRTIIVDTLHNEGKTKKVTAKEADCLQRTVSKHIHEKLYGGTKCNREMCTINRHIHCFERIMKSRPFKNLGKFKMCGKQLESGLKEPPHRAVSKTPVNYCLIPSLNPPLNHRQRQRHFTWAKGKTTGLLCSKSCLQIKIHFLFHLKIRFPDCGTRESQNPCCLRYQCKVSTVSGGLGNHVICWSWSTVFYQVQCQHSHLPGDFGAPYVSLCGPALWNTDFIFQQDYVPPHIAKVPIPSSRTMVSQCLITQQTGLTETP